MKFNSIVLVLFVLIMGCNDPKELNPAEYIAWVSKAEKGFIRSKKVNDVEIIVRYLPSEYLAYKEFQLEKNANFDSLWAEYKCATVFTVTIKADKNNASYGNLMMYGVNSEEDFQAKTHLLSFNIEEFISMKCGGSIRQPVLANFEGYDQISNRISFQVSFVPPGFNCMQSDNLFSDVTITFKDPIWELGTNHFVFSKELLINSPRLKM